MISESFDLPESLRHMLQGMGWHQVHAPYSGAQTYRLTGGEPGTLYLKRQPVGRQEPLQLYRDKLDWLQGKLPAPQVLHYVREAGFEYLLMTEVPGRDAADESFRNEAERMVTLLAEGLKRIHALPIDGCPFDCSLEKRLAVIERRLDAGEVNREKLEARFGDSMERLYHQLRDRVGKISESPVFCHGDYSVPNVIVSEDGLGGFIDLGDAGLSDPYRDLAAIHRSIVRNFGERWLPHFYRVYGIDPDLERLRLYDLLEHFAC